jgi:hypothetical protein
MWRITLALSIFALALLGGEAASAAPIGRKIMSQVGLWTQFDRRGWASGYWQGELIQNFDDVDTFLGHKYSDEAALQLDAMKALGVTHITYELRTADASTANADGTCTAQPYPSCQVCYGLGLDWPRPSAKELTNLKAFLDLLASKGIKLDLLLTTTHMEESPPANSKRWLGAIFDTISGHPAMDLVILGGDAHTIDANGDGVADACGSQGGEAPLWLGPRSYAAKYLEWVIPFAVSHGIAVGQLSAEAIIGDYFLDSQAPAGPNATDRHLWKPIGVMKSIFTKAGVPVARRTYAASFYERRKCSTAQSQSCPSDQDPHEWAEDRLADAIAVIGNRPQELVVTEGGSLDPTALPVERAYESLGFLMNKYATRGGNFWRWSAFQNSEEANPSFGQAVKARGAFTYLPPSKEIIDLGGFHLAQIPNGSFEIGSAKPASWAIVGEAANTQPRYQLSLEGGQPQVPSRGNYSLRLVTGAASTARATSAFIAVSPNRTYTTTANLRFSWSGDPNPAAPPTTRPQVFVTYSYYGANKQPSAVKRSVTFRYFQENSAPDFATFPMQYHTPSDAAFVRIVIGAARNGLPNPITLDADNLR